MSSSEWKWLCFAVLYCIYCIPLRNKDDKVEKTKTHSHTHAPHNRENITLIKVETFICIFCIKTLVEGTFLNKPRAKENENEKWKLCVWYVSNKMCSAYLYFIYGNIYACSNHYAILFSDVISTRTFTSHTYQYKFSHWEKSWVT